jgi:putative ABC transport system permease protein
MFDWLRVAASRVHGLFSIRRLDREFEQELENHLAMLAEENVRRGMAPEQALREARLRLGGSTQLRETHRDLRGLPFVERFFKDVRHALRVLRKSPGFTAVAVLILAVGIGAAITIASVMKCLVLEPLPYPDGGRLVQVWGGEREGPFAHAPLSTPDYIEIREQASAFDEMGAFTTRKHNLGGDRPEAIRGVACTPSLLRALGVQPALGRWFEEAEGQPGARRVAIISQGLWTSRYSADLRAIGHDIRLDGQTFTIVGVMPAGFEVVSSMNRNQAADVWTPLVLDRNDNRRNVLWLPVIGRLKPGVTSQMAKAELRAIAARLARAHPEANQIGRRTFWPVSLSLEIVGYPALRLSWLLAAVWVVLSLACQNVACMLLARGLRRQTEIAVRVSMGAARGHIIRLLLTESLLLSLLAGAAGIVLAMLSLRVLAGFLPPGLAPRGGIRIDGWVLLFSVGLSGAATLMSGLAPALVAAKTDFIATLKEGGNHQSGSKASQRRLRRLVIGQIAAALVLVNGAILLATNYRSLLETQRGLASERVLTADIALNGPGYLKPAARIAFWERLIERVRRLPSVQAAAVTTKLPFELRGSVDVLAEGQPYDARIPRPMVERPTMSPGYFTAVGIPLLRGRMPEDADSRTQIQNIVVNRALADLFWPGLNPIGKHLRGNCSKCPWWVVVGLVDNVRQLDDAPALPEMYFPYKELPEPESKLVVRSLGDPRSLTVAIRNEVAALDADVALANVRTMKAEFDSNTQSLRFLTWMVNLFMAVALGLAAIGTYGTLSFYVAQRSREIGVRIALGSSRGAILLVVFRQAARWIGIGAAAGLALTLGMAEILRSMMHAINPLDALSVCASVAVVVVATLLAAWLPAHRAMRIDPMTALRSE